MYHDLAAGRRRRAGRPSPLFLLFLGLAALGAFLAWTDGSDSGRRSAALLADFGVFLFVLAAWVVTLCVHEFGHAYAAYRAGDRDVEAAGYLTLNPFKYAHPLLSLVLPLIFIAAGGIGLPGGAVYLHPQRFRSRTAQSLTAFAGPLANAVFAVVVLAVARHHDVDGAHLRFWSGLAFLGFLQVSATVLNLLPVPGLDGYSIIEPWLAPETRRAFAPIKPWGMIGLFVLLQVPAINRVFFEVVFYFYDLSGLARVLSSYGRAFFRFWNVF